MDEKVFSQKAKNKLQICNKLAVGLEDILWYNAERVKELTFFMNIS